MTEVRRECPCQLVRVPVVRAGSSPPEFKAEVVSMVEATGGKIAQVAREMRRSARARSSRSSTSNYERCVGSLRRAGTSGPSCGACATNCALNSTGRHGASNVCRQAPSSPSGRPWGGYGLSSATVALY